MTYQRKLVIASIIHLGQRNGPAIHLCSLVRHFVASGYEVVLIVPQFGDTPALPLPNKHLKVIRTRGLSLRRIPNSLNVFMQLSALWRHRRFGPVYIRSAPMSFILTAAARLFGIKGVFVEINGWFADELRVLRYPALFARLAERLQITEAGLADGIRVVTMGLNEVLKQTGLKSHTIAVIENGTDLEIYHPMKQQACRRQLGLALDRRYLAFSGNLAPWQDLPTLFQALNGLRTQGMEVELLVAGAGEHMAAFQRQAKTECGAGVVHFLGGLTPEKVNVVLNAADIAVAPFTHDRNSRIGLSPLKIRDYAAAGKVMISNTLPGLDRLHEEDWISLVPCENSAVLAEAIQAMLALPPVRLRTMGQSARRFAQEHYDWKIVMDRLERMMREGTLLTKS